MFAVLLPFLFFFLLSAFFLARGKNITAVGFFGINNEFITTRAAGILTVGGRVICGMDGTEA